MELTLFWASLFGFAFNLGKTTGDGNTKNKVVHGTIGLLYLLLATGLMILKSKGI